MSGFVLSVRLDGSPPDEAEARRVADAAPWRSAAGCRLERLPSAVAIALAGDEETVAAADPVSSADASLILVADARIDNRGDVAAALDRPDLGHGNDAALLLHGYQHWGDALVDRLMGDFAFAVFDARRRTLFAARDATGLRPLFFHATPARVLIASEVGQILAASAVSAAVNDARIAARLAGVTCPPDWTFYRDVRRLPPAHTLRIQEGGRPAITSRVLAAPDGEFRGTLDDAAERLRDELRRAVRVRLDVARQPGLLLSGGLDSLAIGGVAGQLRHANPGLPGLDTFTFADDSPEADESPIARALAEHYGMPHIVVPGSGAWPLAEYPAHGPARDAPDRFPNHVLFDRSLEAARERGVRVLMTGHRGDAVIGGIATDYAGRLFRAGPVAFWRELTAASAATGASRAALLNRYLLGRAVTAVWPGARAARRRLIGRVKTAHGGLPVWLHPSAAERFGLIDMARQSVAGPSRLDDARRRRYEGIVDSRLGDAAEALERHFARMGIRPSDPWADVRLARFVLQLPEHIVIPPGSMRKGLLRHAMRGVLPEAVRRAADKRLPRTRYDHGLFNRSRATVRSLIERSRTAERGLVDGARLLLAYERARSGAAPFSTREWHLFWRFLDVEDWLRRYHDGPLF